MERTPWQLLVAFARGSFFAIDGVVIRAGLEQVVEEAAFLLACFRVGFQVVGSAVMREDAKAGGSVVLAGVQFDGVILVAIRFDVSDLEHRLLDDVEVVGECGGLRVAKFP